MWAEQVFSLAADAAVGGAGTAFTLGSGAPDITCAFLLDLVNRKLRQIAYDTAVPGMTPAQATAYQQLEALRGEIMEACDGTPDEENDEPGETPEETPEEPTDDGDGPSGDDGPTAPPPPEPEAPTPPEPSERELCCAIHGTELPTIDTSRFDARRVRRGVVLTGIVTASHPCGLETLETEIVVYWRGGRQTRLHRRRSDHLREGSEFEVDLRYRRMPIRGAESGYLYVRATSACGRTVRVTVSPYGRTQHPKS